MSKRALVFYGGWEGHSPDQIAKRFETSLMACGFEVILSSSLDCLNDEDTLKQYDLIIPCWTMGELSQQQEAALCAAVRSGVGLAGAHGGMGDAFRSAAEYNYMVGGQFVSHPQVGEYVVRVVQAEHPLTELLPVEFKYDSEQYYLHVDPKIDVLLETDYNQDGEVVAMPVAWTKTWGVGRVFYCSLGHAPEEYDTHPYVWDFIIKGAGWACR